MPDPTCPSCKLAHHPLVVCEHLTRLRRINEAVVAIRSRMNEIKDLNTGLRELAFAMKPEEPHIIATRMRHVARVSASHPKHFAGQNTDDCFQCHPREHQNEMAAFAKRILEP